MPPGEKLFAFDGNARMRIVNPIYAKVPPKGAKGKIGLDRSDDSLIVKRFLPSMTARELNEAKQRIETMLESKVFPSYYPDIVQNIATPKFAWPVEALYSDRNRQDILGFTMPQIRQDRANSLAKFWVPSERDLLGFKETYEFRVTIAGYLAERLSDLHAQSIYAVDFNDTNIWIDKLRGLVSLIDCDGFSIPASKGRFPASAVAPGIRCPEGKGKPISALGKAQDLFALGVHIFRLLNRDIHPFDCDFDFAGGTSRQEKIDANHYAYAMKPDQRLRPVDESLHEFFPTPHRLLFDRCFAAAATIRPEATEWMAALGLSRSHGAKDSSAVLLEQFAKRMDGGTITLPGRVNRISPPPPLAPSPTPLPSAPPAPVALPPASHLPPPSKDALWKWLGGGIAALFVISLINRGGNNSTTPPQQAGVVSGAVDAAIGPTPSAVSGYEQSNSITRYLVRDTNVRQQPTSNSANITMLSRAEAVQGVMVSGTDPHFQWFKITSGPQTGYFIAGSNLSANGRLALDTSFSGSKRIYSSGSIYGEADRNSTVLQEADAGMTLNVVGTVADGLVEISLRSGVIGYVDRSIFSASSDAVAEPQGAGPCRMDPDQKLNTCTEADVAKFKPEYQAIFRGYQAQWARRVARSGGRAAGQTLTCILPSGEEVQTAYQACRDQGGVISSN